MRLIVDANILFSALIKDSSTAKILVDDGLKLYAPEFLFEEFAKYEDYILKKTNRTKENFKALDLNISFLNVEEKYGSKFEFSLQEIYR